MSDEAMTVQNVECVSVGDLYCIERPDEMIS